MANHHILLSNKDSALIFVDCTWVEIPETASMDAYALAENWRTLARIAALRGVPAIATELENAVSNSTNVSPLSSHLETTRLLYRQTINPWEDEKFLHSVAATGRWRLIIAGAHTEGAVLFAALSALQQGYDVYLVRYAVAGTTCQDHATAAERMSQAGVVPVTLRQVELEWGRGNPM